VTWRAAWADVTNLYLERAGRAERIDHRSNAARGLDEQPTIHEGVTARALERKGIIADRCEINRQIKADNALLRELKAAVRKLAQAVKNTLPVIAEAMEKLRANMIVFRYQLRHIGRGRQRMKDYIHAVQPNLVRYTELVQEIRGKGKERKSLLAQKKETPLYLIPKQCELSRHIAELTEELEELKSEKDMLLHSLECSDDAGIAAVKKDISTMEAALKKLSQQEEKYTAELNDALQQYADLKTQSAEFDPDELQDARLDLRPAMERSVVDRVQSAYGDKYDYLMMYDSKRDVADILHEETEARTTSSMGCSSVRIVLSLRKETHIFKACTGRFNSCIMVLTKLFRNSSTRCCFKMVFIWNSRQTDSRRINTKLPRSCQPIRSKRVCGITCTSTCTNSRFSGL